MEGTVKTLSVFLATLFVLFAAVHALQDEENELTDGCDIPQFFPRGTLDYHGETVWADDQGKWLGAGSVLRFRCSDGYKLQGPAGVICGRDGTWEQQLPKCTKQYCDRPKKIDGGYWETLRRNPEQWRRSRRNPEGSKIYLKCFKGYVLQNPNENTMSCSKVGDTELEWTWDGSRSFCRKLQLCPDPGSPAGQTGFRVPEDGPFWEGDKVLFGCAEGFELVGQESIICGTDSKWNFPRPRCKPNVTCEDIPSNLNGELEFSSPERAEPYDYYVPEDTLELKCHPGYSPNYTLGHDMIICNSYGFWDEPLTVCQEACCTPPKPPENGHLREEDDLGRDEYDHGDEVRFRCKSGYRLQGHNWNRCEYGDWKHPVPTCKEITCRDPSPPEHGLRNGPSKFTVGSTVTFTCFQGYTLIGSESRTCMDNGQWDGILTRCNFAGKGKCQDPGTPLDGYREGNSFNVGDTLSFKCNPGFYLLGSATRTCQGNGQWDGKETRCRGDDDVDRDEDVKIKLLFELDEKLVIQDSENSLSPELRRMIEHPPDNDMAGRAHVDLDFKNSGGHLIFFFVFDSSDSIGRENFQTSIKFARSLVRRVGVSHNVHVGIVSYAKEVDIKGSLFPLNNTMNLVMDRLANLEYKGGGTNTKAAMAMLQKMMATVSSTLKGVRIKSVVFLVTDGLHTHGTPDEKAKQLKDTGVEIFVIGLVGHKSSNTRNMEHIASSSDHVFYVNRFETLEYLVDRLLTNSTDYSHCGISVRNSSIMEIVGRIKGGQDAVIHWPWMAHLKLHYPDKSSKSCGGSIIDNRWILTAAHCLDNVLHPDQLTVTVGMLKMQGQDEGARQRRFVEKFVRHPNYTTYYDYDAALLKLKTELIFGRYIRRICLPPDLKDIMPNSSLYRPGETVTVIGFGDTESGEPSNHLQEVEMFIQNDTTCRDSIKGSKAKLTDRMLCAGHPDGGKDACDGDSGGPLMQELHGGSQIDESYWVQSGVVSWGMWKKCGAKGKYGFYTHVAKVKPWIMETLKTN